MMTNDETRRLAALSQIFLSEEEVDGAARALSRVLVFLDGGECPKSAAEVSDDG